MPKPAETIHRVYHGWLPLVMLGVIVVWWFGVSSWFHPPIGYYIGTLAFMAALVTIWPPENNWAKAAWVGVFGLLTVMEIRGLYHDRDEYQLHYEEARRQENNRFLAILSQNQRSFTGTIGEIKGLASLSRENSLAVTGGNSVAYLAPQSSTETSVVEFAIVNLGRYPLTGVTVELLDTTIYPFKNQTPVTVGTLAGHVVLPIPLSITPAPGPDGVATFTITIRAQNGTSRQLLQFRKGKKMIWDWRFSISRESPRPHSMIPRYSSAKSDVKGLKLSYGWIEDRKPQKPKIKP